MRLALPASLLLAVSLRGQTVVASSDRFLSLPGGGEAIFVVNVTAPASQSLAGVLDALAPAGIRAQDLAGRAVGRLPGGGEPAPLAHYLLFRIARPASRYAETKGMLQAFEPRAGIALGFDVRTQPGQDDIDTTRANALPGLFREVKAQAEHTLIEAGYRPGAIVELVESIESNRGFGVRLTLSLRMARLGAPASQTAIVSTVVAPPAEPYRFGPPVLHATYTIGPPRTRAQLFETLAPAGLNETHLTSVRTDPYATGNEVAFTYEFSAPAGDGDAVARLLRLPMPEGSGANIQYPATVSAAAPAALANAARLRAATLAGLLGGTLGESAGVSPDILSSRRVGVLIGFIGRPRPGQVNLFEPGAPGPLRYRFAVINANQ